MFILKQYRAKVVFYCPPTWTVGLQRSLFCHYSRDELNLPRELGLSLSKPVCSPVDMAVLRRLMFIVPSHIHGYYHCSISYHVSFQWGISLRVWLIGSKTGLYLRSVWKKLILCSAVLATTGYPLSDFIHNCYAHYTEVGVQYKALFIWFLIGFIKNVVKILSKEWKVIELNCKYYFVLPFVGEEEVALRCQELLLMIMEQEPALEFVLLQYCIMWQGILINRHR